MFPVLLFLFILVPIIEIALFVQVGGVLGLWPTLFLVLLTAVVGASLVRSQGIATLMSVQDRLNQGELPAQQIVEGVMLAVAGVLLLTPGFMTDTLGLVVLLPGPRAALAKYLMTKVKVQSMHQSGFGGGFGSQGPFSGREPFDRDQNGDVYDGEYERKDKQEKKDHSDDDDQHRLH
ncbi:FxsA family protein [Photobacterium halotolerans]|uniref:Exclusion suppressor FxsA n=1 Tax=Photobacterium halotolerans TaxID=265726 RepID=A0A0F5V8B1_9GAMM|nr:FxsA family protein [Photobacterium halotolerans]KKC98363.1 exclusion suppressor FxsA [Photobacterium halotolerans]